MLDQVYEPVSTPVESALSEVVLRISTPLEQDRIDWYVGGSMAARLLGANVAPHDIDLGTTRTGVDRIASLLTEYLIEPIAPTDWPGSGIVRGARAFVGTFQSGARVEWAFPIEPRAPLPFEEWSGKVGDVRLLEASFRGRPIRVTRPEYALVRAYEKRRASDVTAIADVVHRLGPDGPLLDALLARSTLSKPRRQELRRQTLGDRLG